MDSDEEEISLSASALEALSSFYSERDAKEKQFEDLRTTADGNINADKLSISAFPENWNASQFWFTDETAARIASALLEGVDAKMAIAVISTPSVFVQLRNLVNEKFGDGAKPLLKLFEYDERFNIFAEYIPYDFTHPLRLPEDLKGQFSRIIYDPPFHSIDCQTRMAITVRWLAQRSVDGDHVVPESDDQTRIVLCTGKKVEELILQLLRRNNVRRTDLELRHTNQLMNDYKCYANFSSGEWSVQSDETE